MTVLRQIALAAALLLVAASGWAQAVPDNLGASSNSLPPLLKNVGFDPQLNAQLPLDVPFVDEQSRPVMLRDYFEQRPVVLTFVYFTCPVLCSQVEQALVGALKMNSFNPGKDYDVVFISIDPSDTPDAALHKKHQDLARYARPTTDNGWHYLTGTKESIAAVANAANFRFAYDPQTKLFGHASGVLILTPNGRISRYFYGIDYPPSNVRLGLVDASAGKIGSPIDHVLLFCYQYDPTRARYSATVLTVLRMGAVATMLCLVIGFVIFRRREHGSGAHGGNLPPQGAH